MQKRWQDWAVLILAVWLLISPWWFGYDDAAATVSRVFGILMIAFAALALRKPRRWQERINILLAVLALFTPFFIFTPEAAAWNQLIAAVLIIVMARSALKVEIDPNLA